MALMKEELDLKDEEIVIVIRRAGQRKPEFVMQDEQTDLALRSDAWRERAKDTLVAGLRRPDSDQPCAFALLGCVGALGMTLRVSGERTDAVWDAVAHFLARPRTFDEIVAVIARPCACDAGAFNTRLHRAGRARFAPLVDMIAMPFAWAVIELARILAFAMELCRDRAFVLWRTAKRVRTAEEAGTRLEWPQRWEQLFPHGVEDSFRGVAVWFGMAGDRTFYGALFQVVTGYMVQAHGVILPFLVNSRYIAAAVVRYIDDEGQTPQIRASLLQLMEARTVRNWGRHFVPIEARLQDASIHMGSLMEFLDLLGSASLVERLKLLQLESGKLLVACDRAMTVSDEQRDAVERLYTKKHARHFKEQHIRFFVIAVDILLWLPPLPNESRCRTPRASPTPSRSSGARSPRRLRASSRTRSRRSSASSTAPRRAVRRHSCTAARGSGTAPGAGASHSAPYNAPCARGGTRSSRTARSVAIYVRCATASASAAHTSRSASANSRHLDGRLRSSPRVRGSLRTSRSSKLATRVSTRCDIPFMQALNGSVIQLYARTSSGRVRWMVRPLSLACQPIC
jgi:hypothetical protein